MGISQRLLPVFIIIFLSYWAMAPLFIPGFFPIHDNTQVERVFEMHQSLKDGMFPVRWVSDLGYNFGYPIFNFYAPLAYYVGAFFMFLGFDALAATKGMIMLGILLAGISMYLFAKEFWGRIGGIVAALAYVYAPYHALQVYVRGDVAEFWAYAFIPLSFWGVYKVFLNLENSKLKTQNLKILLKSENLIWMPVLMGSVGYAGIILSHNLTAMMVTPFLFAFAFLLFFQQSKHNMNGFGLFVPLLLGILLAAFYWLPTLSEMKYTNVLSVVGGGSDYKDHFVCPIQLWESPWGFAGSASGCIDGMSFKIGKVHILLSLVSLSLFFIGLKKQRKETRIILFSVAGLFLSLFFMLDISKFIWDAIPQMAFFQFPWRFLIMISFFVSFLAGAIILLLSKLKNKWILWVTSGMVIVAIIGLNTEVFDPLTIENKKSSDFTSKQWISWTASKISDEYMPRGFYKPKNESEVPNKKIATYTSANVGDLQEKTQKIEAIIEASEKTKVVFHLAYFPAWQVYIDGQRVPYERFDRGLSVQVPSGKHVLTAIFEQTPIEKIGNLLSMTGVLILVLGIIRNIYGKKSS